jgi:hypothetical protein
MNWLDRSIRWHRTRDVYMPFAASYDGRSLDLRLGDFPAEPLYTLLVDGVEMLSLDSPWPAGWRLTVVLRDEADGRDRRSLVAYLEPNGDFVLDGQDLGPAVESVFGAGIREYEWLRTIPSAEVPRLVNVLGGGAGEDVLEVLERWLATHQAVDLEQLLQENDLSGTFWSRLGD